MKTRERIIQGAGILTAAVVIVIHCVLTYRYGVKFINSDRSAELMLGKILAEHNQLLSKDWYYSTELRVFSMNLIYAFAWKMVDTYTGVMVLSQAIGLALLYFSQVFLYKQAGLKWHFIYPLVLLFPMSIEYYMIVLFGLHYIPHIVTAFITLGLLFALLRGRGDFDSKNEISEKYLRMREWVIPAASGLLGLLSGMGGMRILMMLYLPLAALTVVMVFLKEQHFFFWRWKRETLKLLVFGAASLAGAAAGYIVNVCFLQKYYFFQSWQDICFDRVKGNMLFTIIEDYFNLMGFRSGKVFSFQGILSVLAVAVAVGIAALAIRELCRFKLRSFGEQCLLLYVLMAHICILCIYMFSDLYYESRYYIPVLVFLWPVAFMGLERQSTDGERVVLGERTGSAMNLLRPVIMAGIAVSAVLLTVGTYQSMLEKDETACDREVTEFLMKEGYEYGFATFWHADVITQLSEQKITVCPIETLEKMNRYKWLTSREILYPDWDGAVFLVIEDIEHEIYQYASEILQNTDRIIYSRNGRWVYVFESYEEFAGYLTE
ncbi:MAG: hypothetical protein NC081_09195 [Roseburia sp.]|nr:hypothetical protein [Roseburia sp.]